MDDISVGIGLQVDIFKLRLFGGLRCALPPYGAGNTNLSAITKIGLDRRHHGWIINAAIKSRFIQR